MVDSLAHRISGRSADDQSVPIPANRMREWSAAIVGCARADEFFQEFFSPGTCIWPQSRRKNWDMDLIASIWGLGDVPASAARFSGVLSGDEFSRNQIDAIKSMSQFFLLGWDWMQVPGEKNSRKDSSARAQSTICRGSIWCLRAKWARGADDSASSMHVMAPWHPAGQVSDSYQVLQSSTASSYSRLQYSSSTRDSGMKQRVATEYG